MTNYDREFDNLVQQIDRDSDPTAIKDEIIIAQTVCDMLIEQEVADGSKYSAIISDLDSIWGKCDTPVSVTGEGLLFNKFISRQSEEEGSEQPPQVNIVAYKSSFIDFSGVSEGFFIEPFPLYDSDNQVTNYRQTVVHRTRLCTPVEIEGTVFYHLLTPAEEIDNIRSNDEHNEEYLTHIAPELYEHIRESIETATDLDEFVKKLSKYGLDYHNYKEVSLSELNKYINKEVSFSDTLPFVIEGCKYGYLPVYETVEADESDENEDSLVEKYQSFELPSRFFAYIDGIHISSYPEKDNAGDEVYSIITFSLMARAVIDGQVHEMLIPLNNNTAIMEAEDLLDDYSN